MRDNYPATYKNLSKAQNGTEPFSCPHGQTMLHPKKPKNAAAAPPAPEEKVILEKKKMLLSKISVGGRRKPNGSQHLCAAR